MTEDTNHVWHLMNSMRVCMLTSWNGKTQNSRPMTARAYQDRHEVYFLDKNNSEKEHEIKQFPAISMSFCDTLANTYVAVSGHAVISNDRSIITEIWSEFDKAYFNSPQDPNIRLITVRPESAELWDGPNKIVASIKMLAAAATGYKPTMGDNKKVAM